MEPRPNTYEDTHSYVPKMGTLEYWKGAPGGLIEFRFKMTTADGEHQGEFACFVQQNTTGDCRQKMLRCIQEAHDWRTAHETPVGMPV